MEKISSAGAGWHCEGRAIEHLVGIGRDGGGSDGDGHGTGWKTNKQLIGESCKRAKPTKKKFEIK